MCPYSIIFKSLLRYIFPQAFTLFWWFWSCWVLFDCFDFPLSFGALWEGFFNEKEEERKNMNLGRKGYGKDLGGVGGKNMTKIYNLF